MTPEIINQANAVIQFCQRLIDAKDAYNQTAAEIIMRANYLQMVVLEETTLRRAADGDLSRTLA